MSSPVTDAGWGNTERAKWLLPRLLPPLLTPLLPPLLVQISCLFKRLPLLDAPWRGWVSQWFTVKRPLLLCTKASTSGFIRMSACTFMKESWERFIEKNNKWVLCSICYTSLCKHDQNTANDTVKVLRKSMESAGVCFIYRSIAQKLWYRIVEAFTHHNLSEWSPYFRSINAKHAYFCCIRSISQ